MARFSNTSKLESLNDVFLKSTEDKISLRAALNISPSNLLKVKNRKKSLKIRIVADACFR